MDIVIFLIGLLFVIVPIIAFERFQVLLWRDDGSWYSGYIYVLRISVMVITTIIFVAAALSMLIMGLTNTVFGAEPTQAMRLHYADYRGTLPRENTVYVCHAHGCKKKVGYTFDYIDIAVLKRILHKPASATQERKNIRYAIAWMESTVCTKVGTCEDVAGSAWRYDDVDGQLDCVDESINTSSYMMILRKHGLLRHHKLATPVWKGFPMAHWSSSYIEEATGKHWVMDSYCGKNGVKPKLDSYNSWVRKSVCA